MKRGGTPPHVSAALLILSVFAGCGTGGAEGEARGSEQAAWVCPTVDGDPASRVDVSPRPAYATTLPGQIDLCLNQDVDRIWLQTQVFASDGVAATSCVTQEVSRVGRHPVDWAVGTVRTLPLRYLEGFPPGFYDEIVTTIVEDSRGDSIGGDNFRRQFLFQPIDVPANTSPASSSAPSPSDPSVVPASCSEVLPLTVRNDELPAGETVTVVDFDDWRGVATVQPLRHEVVDVENYQGSRLSFSAWNATGDHLRVDIPYLPVAGQAFESEAGFYLPDAAGAEWSGSGHAVVVDRGAGELEVTLSDALLEKVRSIDEPAVTRTAAGGTIIGTVRRECQAPSGDQLDASWSSAYCSEVRQAAGF